MHLVLEQALERDTVPLLERQRGQDLGNLGPGDSVGGTPACLPLLNGQALEGAGWKRVALGLPVKTRRLPPHWLLGETLKRACYGPSDGVLDGRPIVSPYGTFVRIGKWHPFFKIRKIAVINIQV